jgi:hypothetical protein
VSPCAPEKASREEDATYPIEVATSRGKVELRADDYAVYKRWVTTVTHMITSSTAINMRNCHSTPSELTARPVRNRRPEFLKKNAVTIL